MLFLAKGRVESTAVHNKASVSERTFCVPAVGVVLRKLLQIVFEQHLVARNPLHRLQHVVLQRQGATHLLTLAKSHHKRHIVHMSLQ